MNLVVRQLRNGDLFPVRSMIVNLLTDSRVLQGIHPTPDTEWSAPVRRNAVVTNDMIEQPRLEAMCACGRVLIRGMFPRKL